MTIFKTAAAGAALALLSLGGPALAAGCGGYVNLAVWGCAPWDNNPPRAGVTPGYRAPAPKPAPRPVVQPNRPVAQPNVGGRIIGDAGAGAVGRSGAGVLSDNGLGARNGGRILSDQGGGLAPRR